MKLIFTNGSLKGKTLDYDAPIVTIGSNKNNILVLSDDGISGRHVRFEEIDKHWFAKDLGSTNGLKVNGQRITQKERVYDGDIIKIGVVYCELLLADGIKRPPIENSLFPEVKLSEEVISPEVKIEEAKPQEIVVEVKEKVAGMNMNISSESEEFKICVVPETSSENLPSKENLLAVENKEVIEVAKIDGENSADKPIESSKEVAKDNEIEVKIVSVLSKKNVLNPHQKHDNIELRRKMLHKDKMSNRIRLGVLCTLGLLVIFYVMPQMLRIIENKYATDLIEAENNRTLKDNLKKIYIDPSAPPVNKPTPKVVEVSKVVVQTVKIPLYIQSSPSGATVEIDGEVLGVTPFELQELADGVHNLTLFKPGYKAIEYYFKYPESPLQAHTLEQDDYTMLVTSKPPGAAILVGGQLRGNTPTLLRNLPEGTNRVTLSAPGYVSKTIEIEVSQTKSRKYLNVELVDHRGTLAVVTHPPKCKIFMSGDFMGVSKAAKEEDVMSEAFVISDLLPGEYTLEVRSADESEILKEKVAVTGGMVTSKEFKMWVLNTMLTLHDGTKVHGMLMGRKANGELIFSPKKGEFKIYNKDDVTAIEESSMQKKYGFTEGIAIDKKGFKPLLTTIFDENDDRDFKAILEKAEDVGKLTSGEILKDQSSLDLIGMVTKYRNKKITVTGSVSFIRAGELKYVIVLDDKIECFLDKDESLTEKLKSIVGKNVTISGLCLAVGGIDRIVVVNTEIKE